jgi:hypothetical protein
MLPDLWAPLWERRARQASAHGRGDRSLQDLSRQAPGTPAVQTMVTTTNCSGQASWTAWPDVAGAGAGISSQVRPSSIRPPAFGVRPPHCLKKKGTCAAVQA